MDIVADMHATLAQTTMYFFFVIGVWGLIEYARGGELGGNIGGAFVIARYWCWCRCCWASSFWPAATPCNPSTSFMGSAPSFRCHSRGVTCDLAIPARD